MNTSPQSNADVLARQRLSQNGTRATLATASEVSNVSNHGPANWASVIYPMCQPMPMETLVQKIQFMDSVSAQRHSTSDNNGAVMQVMHAYIADVIQNKPNHDPEETFSCDAHTVPVLPGPQTEPAASTGALPFSASSGVAERPIDVTHRVAAALQQLRPACTVSPAYSKQHAAAAASAIKHGRDSTGKHDTYPADASIIQKLRSAGLSLPEVEVLVSRLMHDSLDAQNSSGVADLVSAEGQADATAPAPPATAVAAEAASGGSISTESKESGVEGSGGEGGGSPGAEAPLSGRVSPFIQRPYHVLNALHGAAQLPRNASGATTGGAGVGSSHTMPPPPSDGGGTLQAERSGEAGIGLGGEAGMANGGIVSAGAEPTVRNVTLQKVLQDDDDGVSSCGGVGVPACVAREVSDAWHSVQAFLINAGPQAVQPGPRYLRASGNVSGSTWSSTEQDAVSVKSEEVVVAEAVQAKKSKRKRGKRGKSSSQALSTGTR